VGNNELQDTLEGIAVIGMNGRFPGAADIEQFWLNLRDGVESVRFFSDEELQAAGIDGATLSDPNYVKAKAMLDDIELFDGAFFGLNPRESAIMDPQHRVFLECAWGALEDAGYNPETFDGAIGVYAGASLNSYLLKNLSSNPDAVELAGTLQIMIGNDKDFLPTRVSYKLNLKGPAVNVQTACSTSLVAAHLACRALLNYECDMALAGGVSITVPQKSGYFFEPGGINSPDGHCRAFDAQAQGTLAGNGAGIVVLKRLEDALLDGDGIHAVIRGSAINNDGSFKVSYTAPSQDGQAKVIAEAQAIAQVEPETITYVETHGTGTDLGDVIEVAALTQAFRAGTQKKGFCAIGAVKTNIGHLDAAAGVTGLIKTVLALKHRLLPPSLHFEQPNPQIDFATSPFYVNNKLSEWKAGQTLRRAGVSSFGIGGTNAHLIVEEAPQVERSVSERQWHLLPLSAKSDAALEKMADNLSEHLGRHDDLNLADAAYTLQVGRKAFNHRCVVVCRDREDALRSLPAAPHGALSGYQEASDRPVVFMFPGGGAQYPNMGRDLYEQEPVFREQVDLCAELLRPQLGYDLRELLYPGTDHEASISAQMKRTSIALPALFAVEYALAKLWMSWGVRPSAMIGHSLGEYVAACLAGVFSLKDALSLVTLRGRLFEQLPSGAMLSISLGEDEARALMSEKLSLAAINGPSLCVASGPVEKIEELAEALVAKGVEYRRLQIDVAAHSEMVTPILAPFSEFVGRIRLHEPTVPYLSNVTGTWVTAAEATNPAYWTNHLRRTVRFADGLGELLSDAKRILLEVGPGHTLSTLAAQHPAKTEEQTILSSLRHPQDPRPDRAVLLNALGRLWLAGAQIGWPQLHASEQRRRLQLPTYPFERRRCWIDAQPSHRNNRRRVSLEKKPDIADWFYVPSWKRTASPLLETANTKDGKSRWLVFADECGLAARLVKELERSDEDVLTVFAGEDFERLGERGYAINPGRREHYDALLEEVSSSGGMPCKVVHLWSVTMDHTSSDGEELEKSQELCFYSLLYLAQALSEQNAADPIQLVVLSNDLFEVTGGESVSARKATLLGPCKVIPKEYENIACRLVDIALPEAAASPDEKLVEQLVAELTAPSIEPLVAYRRNHRWAQTFETMRLDAAVEKQPRLREKGVYLITGGLGGIGLALAQYLAQAAQARLVLIGRSPFPAREEWEDWLAAHDREDQVSRKIKTLLSYEEAGAEVLVLSADVSSREQMLEVLSRTSERFGAIHGIIHSAGVPGGGLIQLKTAEIAERVLAPKVRGTLVLDDLFAKRELDFFLLCSSLNSILGAVGQVDYTAANAFLDAFAQSNTSRRGIFTVSVNWEAWQEVGMAVETAIPLEFREGRAEALKSKITPQEGVEVFRRILRSREPQVVISTRDFHAVIEQSNEFVTATALEELEKSRSAKPTHPRPPLGTPYVAPHTEIEEQIAEIWQNLFGFEQVGVNDNFFELGGHSLLAIQLTARLRSAFQIDVPLRKFFTAPSVAGAATLIEESLLAEIEGISEEEAERLLTSES
jgi:acyl transferase domain-containing protein/acyl carrier protein